MAVTAKTNVRCKGCGSVLSYEFEDIYEEGGEWYCPPGPTELTQGHRTPYTRNITCPICHSAVLLATKSTQAFTDAEWVFKATIVD